MDSHDAHMDGRSEARYEADPRAEPDTREVAEAMMRGGGAERIERLERALEPFVESFRDSYPEAFADLAHLPDPWSVPIIVPAAQIRVAAAALVVEEDATP